MFKQVPTARIEELLENHDVHTTVEILIGERPLQKSDDDDSDDLPVIDLTVSIKLQKSKQQHTKATSGHTSSIQLHTPCLVLSRGM